MAFVFDNNKPLHSVRHFFEIVVVGKSKSQIFFCLTFISNFLFYLVLRKPNYTPLSAGINNCSDRIFNVRFQICYFIKTLIAIDSRFVFKWALELFQALGDNPFLLWARLKKYILKIKIELRLNFAIVQFIYRITYKPRFCRMLKENKNYKLNKIFILNIHLLQSKILHNFQKYAGR